MNLIKAKNLILKHMEKKPGFYKLDDIIKVTGLNHDEVKAIVANLEATGILIRSQMGYTLPVVPRVQPRSEVINNGRSWHYFHITEEEDRELREKLLAIRNRKSRDTKRG